MMYEPGAPAKETPGLEEYLAAIRQRKLLVVVCTVLGLTLAFLFASSRTDSYRASAKVLVNPTNVGTTDSRLKAPVLEREREVIASNAVAQLVVEDVGIATSPLLLLRELEVIFVDRSDSLEILYVDTDPKFAQDVANSFARSYVSKRNGEAEDLDEATVAALAETVALLDAQILDAEQRIEEITAELARSEGLGLATSGLREQSADLRSEVSSLRSDRVSANRELSTATIEKNTRTPPAEVLQFADLPTFPIGLSQSVIMALGLLLGLGAGVGLAFVLERLDRTARESADVEFALGTSVLASIPAFGLSHRSVTSSVVMLAGGRSARVQRAREAFRRLRTSVQFLGTGKGTYTFLITSARPAEGKTTTAINLAVALTQAELKVCLVNADLRRPTIEKGLGIASGTSGLSDWLVDQTISSILVPVASAPGLTVVPSGLPPANPGELLATGRFADLITDLSSQFDVVLIDAPPVLSAADAAVISRVVDGTIIVVDSKRTDTDALLRVRAELDRAGGTMAGAILNRDSNEGVSGLRKDRYAYEKVTAARATE